MSKACAICKSAESGFYLTDYNGINYSKCDVCEYVFQDPVVPARSDEANWFAARDPDGKKRDLTQEKEFKLRNWYGDICSHFSPHSAGRILDVGCGLGYLLSAFDSKWQKYGTELSPFCREFVGLNFPEVNLIELDFGKERASEFLDFFDVVVLYHVIEHVQNPKEFLLEVSSVLKPGGVMVVGTPNMESVVARRFRGNFRLLGPGHVGLFGVSNLTRLLESVGFEVYFKEFPFFKTEYFTFKNLMRMWNVRRISPPFYGNIMTLYARKVS